jgi:hypothetical protein
VIALWPYYYVYAASTDCAGSPLSTENLSSKMCAFTDDGPAVDQVVAGSYTKYNYVEGGALHSTASSLNFGIVVSSLTIVAVRLWKD